MKYYKIQCWEDERAKLRILVCDDLPQIVDACKTVFCSVRNIDSRAEAQELFYQEGWISFLISDSTFNETSGPLHTVKELSVKAWCELYPPFARADFKKRIIVWSGSFVSEHPFMRWYKKSSSPEKDLRMIQALCRLTVSGKLPLERWPISLTSTRAQFGDCVHALLNCLSPINEDAKTLGDRIATIPGDESADVAFVEEIQSVWRDYFAPTQDCYLGKQSKLHKGTEIIGYVQAICNALPEDFRNQVAESLELFSDAVERARREIDRFGDHPTASICLDLANKMRRQLDSVLVAGTAIIERVQALRGERGA